MRAGWVNMNNRNPRQHGFANNLRCATTPTDGMTVPNRNQDVALRKNDTPGAFISDCAATIDIAITIKLEDAMRLGTPDWADKSEEGGRSNAAPYPVTPSVARGLDQAVALGLLVGESWSEWPVGREAMPLRLLWERIAARL